MLKGNAIVGQSGGPTAAINATLAGVIRGAFECEYIDTLYGAFNGVDGMLNDRICSINEIFTNSSSEIDESKLALLSNTPAAALGSCRCKLPQPGSDAGREIYESLLAFFKRHNIRYFFYIGGNDSMDTVAKLTTWLQDKDWEMRLMGVPKTIDNDVVGTDHTPGFGSAAKFIAATMQEILRDTAVYSLKAVTIVEIMGRDAGWLTAAAALPGRICGDAPSLIYLPERVFDYDRFYADVEAALKVRNNVVIAVSEGVRLADGTYVGASAQSGVVDVFGHQYLSGTAKTLELAVKKRLGCKVRSVELNILQRCASHIASKTDLDESAEVGRAAVRAAANGESGKMMCFTRQNEPYKVGVKSEDIAAIANQIRAVPDEYINNEGNGITDTGIDYLLPLIQGEPDIIYENGMPKHFVINR
ncbi:MAG: 6-phosphofructokinase [Clostridiales bacterium]|nr:6-phosphofructokinase [Clostridiales bacterium]